MILEKPSHKILTKFDIEKSIMEYEQISVRFACSRGVAYEIRKHHLHSVAQDNTRHVSYKNDLIFILPFWCKDLGPGKYEFKDTLDERVCDSSENWLNAMLSAEEYYFALIKDGWTFQQVDSILPNSLKVGLKITANLCEWRHILYSTCSKDSNPQTKEVTTPLLWELKTSIPIIFEGLTNIDHKEIQ